MAPFAAAALALILAAAPSFAKDKPPAKEIAKGTGVIVTLNEGREVKGVYLGRHDGAVWVGLDGGEIGLEPETIVKIVPAKTDDSEFLKRKVELAPNDKAGHWGLAEWALKQGLDSSAKAQALIVVGLDPDHEKARRLLRHERIDGVWLEHDDAMQAKGFVQYKGDWISKEQFSRIEAARIAAEEQALRYQRKRNLFNQNIPRAVNSSEPDFHFRSSRTDSYRSPPKGKIQ
jgi:hypothetical protein